MELMIKCFSKATWISWNTHSTYEIGRLVCHSNAPRDCKMADLLGVFTASSNSYQHCIRERSTVVKHIRHGVRCRHSW